MKAPDFTLKDQHGTSVTLSDHLKKGPVVLFFYPADFTSGCTAQACAFRDKYTEFSKQGATVLGISPQNVESKKAFAEKHGLPFSLLADDDGRVRELYGVKDRFFGLLRARETFVIESSGELRPCCSSKVQMSEHVDDALKELAKLELLA